MSFINEKDCHNTLLVEVSVWFHSHRRFLPQNKKHSLHCTFSRVSFSTTSRTPSHRFYLYLSLSLFIILMAFTRRKQWNIPENSTTHHSALLHTTQIFNFALNPKPQKQLLASRNSNLLVMVNGVDQKPLCWNGRSMIKSMIQLKRKKNRRRRWS